MESPDITRQHAENLLNEHFGEGSIFVSYESKILKLNRLLEMAKIINSSLDKESLLESILYSCQGQFFIANAAIFLYDELDSIYALESSTGLDGEFHDLVIADSDPVITLIKKKIELIDIDEQIDNNLYHHFHQHNQLLKGKWIFPLNIKNKLNGFLVLGRKANEEELTYDEKYYLTSFAELASIAVENMILFQLVVMDRMTRLYDHHFFNNRLNHELNRAIRYNRHLALILLDIDHFKKFNDSYGHQEGDTVLIGLADLLKKITRKTDIVARYGGEEFAIILEESNLEEAKLVADKIRTTIEQQSFYSKNNNNYKITVSLGVAAYRAKVVEKPKDLINLADKALYQSKKRGRNRVTTDLEID